MMGERIHGECALPVTQNEEAAWAPDMRKQVQEGKVGSNGPELPMAERALWNGLSRPTEEETHQTGCKG